MNKNTAVFGMLPPLTLVCE